MFLTDNSKTSRSCGWVICLNDKSRLIYAANEQARLTLAEVIVSANVAVTRSDPLPSSATV